MKKLRCNKKFTYLKSYSTSGYNKFGDKICSKSCNQDNSLSCDKLYTYNSSSKYLTSKSKSGINGK